MRDVFLAAVSGLMLILIFPQADFAPLAWVAFVPLLAAIEGKRPGRAFRLGFLSGVLAYAGILYWLVYTLRVYGNIPYPLCVPIVLLLILFLALYTGIFTACTAFVSDHGLPQVAVAPVIWVALEYARGHILSGFPWAALGYSQSSALPFIQIADITSVYGISFLVMGVNAVLCRMLRADEPGERRSLLAWMCAANVLIWSALGYGLWRLDALERSMEREGHWINVALVQGNISQEMKWDKEFKTEAIRIYRELTEKTVAAARPGGPGPDLVVWPETAAPFYFQSDAKWAAHVRGIARDTGVHLLFGCPAYTQDSSGMRYLNRAYLLSPRGEVMEHYDKLHLVLFGEYNPVPFVSKLVSGAGDFSPGKELVTFTFPGGSFGVVICFEAIFPELGRRFIASGAEFLVNITNDAWFGATSAPYQHLAMVAFRAVENRVPVVRAANTGISAVIDSAGRIQMRTRIFERDVLTGAIRIGGAGTTFYTRYGDVFAWACCAVSAVLFALAIVRARRGR